jgi:hypothetical protein
MSAVLRDLPGAEALSGLAGAFFYAGARADPSLSWAAFLLALRRNKKARGALRCLGSKVRGWTEVAPIPVLTFSSSHSGQPNPNYPKRNAPPAHGRGRDLARHPTHCALMLAGLMMGHHVSISVLS